LGKDEVTVEPPVKVLNGEVSYDYILWVDSDILFNIQSVISLITYDRDIVSGVAPTGYGEAVACGIRVHNVYQQLRLKDLIKRVNGDRLVEVDYTGFGFILVKAGVFEALPYPWFKQEMEVINNDVYYLSEDIGWCKRVKALGYKIYVDPFIRVGHEKSVVL